MKLSLIAVAFASFLLASVASGQAVRVDPAGAYTTLGNQPLGTATAILGNPGATVVVCVDSICATPATTYASSSTAFPCPVNAQVTLPGSSQCVSTTGNLGQFGFWLVPGSYWYTVKLKNNTKIGPYALTVGASSGGSGITQLTGDILAGPGAGSQIATLPNVNATPGNFLAANITVNAKGQITAAANGSVIPGITQLTGDASAGPGSGSQAITFATVNANPGSCGDSTHVCQVLSNGKGLILNQTPISISGGGGGAISSSQLTDFVDTRSSAPCLTISAGTFSLYPLSSATFCFAQYAISAATTGANMVLTLASGIPANMVHNGDQISIFGATGSGCSIMNTLVTVVSVSGTSVATSFNNTGCTYTASSATFGANASASGTAYNYGNPDGTIHLEHPTAAGLIVVCTGTCIVQQVPTPGFIQYAGEFTMSTATISTSGNGSWTSSGITDSRSFLYQTPNIVAGLGLDCPPAAGALMTCSVTADVVRGSATNPITGTLDQSLAVRSNLKQGATNPPTCTAGDVFTNTSTNPPVPEICGSGNTWTAIGSGGGGGAVSTGTATLGTSSISSGACGATVTVSATGSISSSTIAWEPNGSIKAVTGYAPLTAGGLSIVAYPTGGNVNFDVCNWTSSSITPGAVTLNWAVFNGGAIASGIATLGVSSIASGGCATVVTVTATGVGGTSRISWGPNASIKAVTGYIAGTAGGLSIATYPTTNAVNFDVCNSTASPITPGAVTLNWAAF